MVSTLEAVMWYPGFKVLLSDGSTCGAQPRCATSATRCSSATSSSRAGCSYQCPTVGEGAMNSKIQNKSSRCQKKRENDYGDGVLLQARAQSAVVASSLQHSNKINKDNQRKHATGQIPKCRLHLVGGAPHKRRNVQTATMHKRLPRRRA